MISSLPALSLSSTFTEVGALVAFIAVLGIALLALLCFSQAREIKRLREWAGRAPERAVEFERAAAQAVRAQQRVASTPAPRPAQTQAAGTAPQPADAARAPVPPPPVTSVVPAPGASPAPRGVPTPPLPATALSGNDIAPGIAVSAAPSQKPESTPATPPIQDRPAQPAFAAASANATVPAAAASANATPPPDAAGESAPPPIKDRPADRPASPLAISASRGRDAQDAVAAGDREEVAALSGRPHAPAQGAAAAAVSSPATPAEARDGEERTSPAPATAAALAAAASAGAPPRASVASQRPPTSTAPERPRTPPAPPERPRTPPAPTRVPAGRRAVAASARELAPSRSAGPPVDELDGGAATRAGAARLRGEPPRATDRRSAGGPSPRTIAAIVIGAVVAVLALMLVTGVFGGGGSAPTRTTGAPATPSTSHTTRTPTKHHSTAGAANASEIAVVVLNGTETPQLAHHAASELVGMGYSKAVALPGRPEGANQVSVVEYTSGHHADAAAVAHSLGVSTVQPIEGSTAGLAGSATVAVVIGQDKASSSP